MNRTIITEYKKGTNSRGAHLVARAYMEGALVEIPNGTRTVKSQKYGYDHSESIDCNHIELFLSMAKRLHKNCFIWDSMGGWSVGQIKPNQRIYVQNQYEERPIAGIRLHLNFDTKGNPV
tara:strand:+ start:54 stop:413 length:360 start_codon:yes stop_codon:yes gene_type:complete